MTYQPSKILRAAMAALACGLSLLLTPDAAAAGATKSFDIPAGEALPALKKFVAQSGEQLLYSAEAVQGVTTHAVKGVLTAREALDQMVGGTDLLVMADKQNGALSLVRDPGPNVARVARMAKASDRPDSNRPREEEVVKLGEFEVFGSKLINADLPRTRDDVPPYVTFSRAQLEASPAANLEDFFRARLPMNQVFGTSATSGLSATSTSTINLRGLGTNQTLILLDGRRFPPRASVGGSTFQADINGIPLGMIERIEVLPATASGIYGGGATGGVINIITRKDYAGVEVTATYQNTFDTDAATRRIDVNGSLALEGGRTMVTLNYSRTDANLLLVQDRDFATRSRALLLANNPAAFYSATTPPAGFLANVRSQTGANLVLKPQFAVAGATALNSPITFVPAGYAGPATDGAGALLANAGRYDLGLPQATNGALASLLAVPTVESFGLGVRRRFGSRVEAYVDVSRMKNDSAAPSPTPQREPPRLPPMRRTTLSRRPSG